MSNNSISNNLPTWLDDTFLISMVGLVGGGIGYLLMFCLKSRCTNIECCCLKCQRTPIPTAHLASVDIRNSGSRPDV